MEVLLIAGPASVFLDRARVLTNLSTGKTGTALAETLRKYRHHITLWYGTGATHPLPTGLHSSERFQTIHDLEKLLQKGDLAKFGGILLPAALPDYDLASAHDLAGNKLSRDKWPGHLEGIRLELKPAPRVLNKIRSLAPVAKIVGWKWEAEGTRSDLQRSAREQIEECRTDACVLNGPAFGEGYLFMPKGGEPVRCTHPAELGHALAVFLGPA
jgi:phosphopantothenoylcysteine decarboxylase/phosphopantothenate--cysteine ligase